MSASQVTQAEVTAWLKGGDVNWFTFRRAWLSSKGGHMFATDDQTQAIVIGALTGKAATETIQAVVERIVRIIEEERSDARKG